jgi:hypothetical protein
MTILSTTDVSREGNDCYIQESYFLVEQFGLYSIIKFYKVTGWSDYEEVTILIATSDKTDAGKKYKEYCKYYKV